MEALSDESMRARDQSLLQAFFSWLLTPPLLPFCPPAPATTPAHLPTARPSPLRASSLEPPPPHSSFPPLLASVPTLCVLPPPSLWLLARAAGQNIRDCLDADSPEAPRLHVSRARLIQDSQWPLLQPPPLPPPPTASPPPLLSVGCATSTTIFLLPPPRRCTAAVAAPPLLHARRGARPDGASSNPRTDQLEACAAAGGEGGGRRILAPLPTPPPPH